MGARATVTSKGQITIPRAIRDRLALQAGDQVLFEESADGIVMRRAPQASTFDRYVGYLSQYADQDVDQMIEDMRGPGP